MHHDQFAHSIRVQLYTTPLSSCTCQFCLSQLTHGGWTQARLAWHVIHCACCLPAASLPAASCPGLQRSLVLCTIAQIESCTPQVALGYKWGCSQGTCGLSTAAAYRRPIFQLCSRNGYPKQCRPMIVLRWISVNIGLTRPPCRGVPTGLWSAKAYFVPAFVPSFARQGCCTALAASSAPDAGIISIAAIRAPRTLRHKSSLDTQASIRTLQGIAFLAAIASLGSSCQMELLRQCAAVCQPVNA